MTKLTSNPQFMRVLFGLFFLFIWLAMAYYILVYSTAIYESGADIPTGEQVVPYSNHGEVVYITPTQDLLKDFFGMTIILLFSAWIILGIFLESVYKVKIFRIRIPSSLQDYSQQQPPDQSKY